MSSKPSKPKATPEEKAMREEASRMWTDVKERFWPIDEKVADRAMDVSRGRVSREEAAMGSMPTVFNPMAPGADYFSGMSAAGTTASRIRGLRNNEHDRKQAGLTNLAATGREIENQALTDTRVTAGNATNNALSRYNAKQAVNAGISRAGGQLASGAAVYGAMNYRQNQPGLQQATPYQYQGGPVMEGAYTTRPDGG